MHLRFIKGAAILCLLICPFITAQEAIWLVAHQDFGLSGKNAWTARLTGQLLTIERPGQKPKSLRISEKELSELRQSLRTNNWTNLEKFHGASGSCNDCPRCLIDFPSGEFSNRVVIYQTDNESPVSPQTARFLSVWKVVKKLAGLASVKDACP
jgi:hypothetical protein